MIIVVIEATGNAAAVAEVLSPYVDRIVIANQSGEHDRAREGEDRQDRCHCPCEALRLALSAGDLDSGSATLALRRQVTRRTQLVRQRSRLKNLIQSILHAHLILPCQHGNLVRSVGANA